MDVGVTELHVNMRDGRVALLLRRNHEGNEEYARIAWEPLTTKGLPEEAILWVSLEEAQVMLEELLDEIEPLEDAPT